MLLSTREITVLLELGLSYSILALGVLITFRVLNSPDLTVEGSFTLGAVVGTLCTLAGRPALGLFAGLAAGALAGLCTALLTTKCGVQPILSGILVMTGLYSVNLWIMGGRSNLPLMREETQAMLGTHDFRAFEASGGLMTGKGRTERTVHRVQLTRDGACLHLMIYGNAFLYNMVRIFAGTLIDVGRGRVEPGAVARALASGDRLQLGVTAPANGLTLLRVFYGGPDDQAEADALFDDPERAFG